MKNNGYKPRVPDIMEAVFDIGYLLFDLIAAVLFFVFSKGNSLFVLYGILTLTLCGGDAFHLVPRVIRAFRGSSDKIKKQLGMGLQISSVTMTVFYILLMYIWKNTFPEMQIPAALEIIIWVSALVRIIVCLLPQNRWCSDNGNQKLSIIRNTVFAVTGIGVILLYALSGNAHDYHLTRMVAAILISFGCYLPVTLMSKKHPNIIRRNGAVIGRRVVVPKILALFGKTVSGLLRDADLNTVADISVVRSHRTDGCITGSACFPAVHKGKAAVSPFGVVIRVPVTGIRDKVHIVRFLCGIGSRTNPYKGSHAH